MFSEITIQPRSKSHWPVIDVIAGVLIIQRNAVIGNTNAFLMIMAHGKDFFFFLSIAVRILLQFILIANVVLQILSRIFDVSAIFSVTLVV